MAYQRGGPRPHRRIAVEHVSGQLLEQRGLVEAHRAMPQLHLRLGPREHRRPRERFAIAMLVDQVEQLRARIRDDGPIDDARLRARLDAQPLPQRERRVQYRAFASAQRTLFGQRKRQANAAPASDDAQSIGVEFFRADGFAGGHGQMRGPNFRLVRRALAPRRQNRARRRHVLGFDEQFRECGMGVIGGGRSEHDFRVGREFDHAWPGAGIGHRHPPHFRIVLGGYHHLKRRRQGAVATHELGAIFGERHFVAVRHHAGGLPRGRPDLAALGVAQIQIATPIVARRVFPPARDGQIVAAAVAGACGREHHGVAAVGQQMRDGRGIVRRQQAPCNAGVDAMHPAGGARVDPRPPCRDPARHPFLQQQLGGAHGRLAMEEGANAPAQQCIGDRHDRHALVMRHECPHDRNWHAFRHARGRVVERFVEAEAPARAGCTQPLKVARGGVRRDHRRERGRIGRDHQVLVEIALEPQLRHAEARILIGQLDVARVVRRFGHAPRQVQPVAVGDLATHHQVIGACEQAAVRRTHHERRHQVFEHRSRPRDQRRAVPDRRRQAAEPEPVPRRDITLRDRDETREARLRCQQIVVARIEPSVGHRVTDRQQIAHRVEQKAELHRIGHLQRGIGQRMQALVQHVRFVRRARRVAAMPLHRVLQRLRPKQHVVAVAAPPPADFVRQRARDIGDRRGEDRDLRPFRRGGAVRSADFPGRRGERLIQLGRGLLEFAVQGRPGIAIAAHGLAQQRERVTDPFVRSLPPHTGGLIRPGPATVAEGDQVAGKIAAVDRRHVLRLEGPQVARVVPVIKVAAIA